MAEILVRPWPNKKVYLDYLDAIPREKYVETFDKKVRTDMAASEWGKLSNGASLVCSGERKTVVNRDGIEVPVVVYGGEEKSPVIFQIHGGEYVAGSAEMDDYICAAYNKELASVVISIGYRLAPDTCYPGPLNDCMDVITYFLKNADQFNIDPERVALSGQGVGAAMAFAIAFMAAHEKSFSIRCIAANAGTFDFMNAPDVTTPRTIDDHILTARCYCTKEEASDILVSPKFADHETLGTLPAVIMALPEIDGFAQSVLDFAMDIQLSGVEVVIKKFEGTEHDFAVKGCADYNEEAAQKALKFMIEGIRGYL